MGVLAFSRAGINSTRKTTNFLSGNPAFNPSFQLSFAVIAGGGGSPGGKGGAGGFRKSFGAEPSGGGAASETPITVNASDGPIQVTVGGGAGNAPANGSPSTFGPVTSLGGGHGGRRAGGIPSATGGSGGGGEGGYGGGGSAGAAGTTGQGFEGATGVSGGFQCDFAGYDQYGNRLENCYYTYGPGGGGGGAGSAGSGATGGAGLATSIRGTSQTFASGNTASAPHTGNSGQSGIIIIRYPGANVINIGAGLTGTTTTVGSDKVTTFTAGTGTVTFN